MYAHMDARIYIISAHVALKMLVHIKQKLCNQLLNAIVIRNAKSHETV